MKLTSLLLIFFIVSINITFADKPIDENYKNYLSSVKDVCEKTYHTKEDRKKVLKKDDIIYKQVDKIVGIIPSPESSISSANGLYVETMNTIYRCAVINTQIVAMKNFKKNLINKYDKVGDIKKKLIQKIDSKIENIKKKSEYKVPDGTFEEDGTPTLITKNACSRENIKDTYNKKNVLINSTYETCKYLYYMDYLTEYYKDINKLGLFGDEEDLKDLEKDINTLKSAGVNINTPGDEQKLINNKIINARKHAKEVFSMTFVAYTEYENNFPIHLLLQIIREDFIVFRKKLHEVLNPINQVVYKIVNCQNL